MDEDEKNNSNNQGGIKNALKQGAKKQAKDSMKKAIKIIIQALKPILLKLAITLITTIIVLETVSYIVDKVKGEKSKKAKDSALSTPYSVSYDSDSEENEEDAKKSNKMIVNMENISSDGAYIIKYQFVDENGNEYSEKDAIEKIKEKIKKAGLDPNKLTDSELKIVGTLIFNGLDIEELRYTEEKLKALALFVKADIASQNFDMRKSSEIGKEVPIDKLSENDEIYGTLQVHRTKVEGGSNGSPTQNEVALEYIAYGDEETTGTFCYMEKQKDLNIINKFSINKEGKLVVAKWGTTTTTYTYQDESGAEISADKVPEKNRGEGSTENFISIQEIDFRRYISKYVLNYEALSDFLIITNNADFCTDLAKLAFNGKIVINIKEELTETEVEDIKDYTDTNLLYDYVKYNITGKRDNVTSAWQTIDSGSGEIPDSVKNRGWNSGMTPTKQESITNGQKITWEWEQNSIKYRLEYMMSSNGRSWILRKEVENTNTTDIPTESNKNPDGDLIANAHIKEQYASEDGKTTFGIDEDYTAKEEKKYKVILNTARKSNLYKFEISEIDTWYLSYKKEYETPEVESTPYDLETTNEKGEFTEKAEEILNTQDAKEIEKDKHVKEFINKKEETFKNQNSGSKNVNCTVTSLKVMQKTKSDIKKSVEVKVSNRYKFGEEKADTTDVKLKNVEYTNSAPRFVDNADNGFLKIYNDYVANKKIDLYLSGDAEDWLTDLFEQDDKTINIIEIFRYMLYIYDGIDRGITEFNLEVLSPKELKTFKSGGLALMEVIKSYENNSLRNYMNETSQDYESVKKYVTQDRSKYIMYYTPNDQCLNFTYGIMVRNAYGEPNNAEYFAEEGIDLNALLKQYDQGVTVYVDAEIIDRIYTKIIKDRREFIKSVLEENGANLKMYQIDALVNVSYQYGNCGQYISGENNVAELYKKYYEKNPLSFKSNAVCETESGLVHFFNDSTERKKRNWLLFSEGKYILSDGTELSGSSVVAEYALQFVGETHERFTSYSPENNIPDIWYPADWCAMFVSYCYNECGLIPDVLKEPYASCGERDILDNRGEFINAKTGYIPEAGDIIFFTDDGGVTSCTHTGIVTDCDGTTVYTVEGNAGGSITTPYWKGSHVIEDKYPIDSVTIFGYFSPNQ